MLNSQSTIDEIREALETEKKKSNYWFIKQHHGEKQYAKWRNRFCSDLYRSSIGPIYGMLDGSYLISSGKPYIISDPVFYEAPSGNHWMSYERATRDAHNGAYSFTYSVAYFETAKYIGMFTPMEDEDGMNGCMYYTPHFFMRFVTRLGLRNQDMKDVMRKFISMRHTEIILRLGKKRGHNEEQIAIKYPGSFGLGSYTEKDGYFMVTVRTFLPEKDMTPQRLHHLKRLGMVTDEEIRKLDIANMESKDSTLEHGKPKGIL